MIIKTSKRMAFEIDNDRSAVFRGFASVRKARALYWEMVTDFRIPLQNISIEPASHSINAFEIVLLNLTVESINNIVTAERGEYPRLLCGKFIAATGRRFPSEKTGGQDGIL